MIIFMISWIGMRGEFTFKEPREMLGTAMATIKSIKTTKREERGGGRLKVKIDYGTIAER